MEVEGCITHGIDNYNDNPLSQVIYEVEPTGGIIQ